MSKKNIELKHLTDNITYRIIDNTIYIFKDFSNINKEDLRLIYKKVLLVVEDNEISYINITSRNLEEKKKFYQDYGFSLSYYDLNKINTLFKGKEKKEEYRCYALMTKKDFLNINFDDDKEKNENIEIKQNNKGFISSMFLLFTTLLFLCYLCIEMAITLVK